MQAYILSGVSKMTCYDYPKFYIDLTSIPASLRIHAHFLKHCKFFLSQFDVLGNFFNRYNYVKKIPASPPISVTPILSLNVINIY